MNESECVSTLSALAHGYRLQVFRLLIRKGSDGLSAGDIAEHLELAPSSLSFHLSQLERAGLIHSRREQRHIIYAADLARMGSLLSFLTEDCCAGHPEICANILPASTRSGPRARAARTSHR